MSVTIQKMTQEDIDVMMSSLDREAKMLGFENEESFNMWKYHASEGLQKFGGSFSELIGRAMCHADSRNMFRLIMGFRPMMEEHAELYRKYLRNRE